MSSTDEEGSGSYGDACLFEDLTLLEACIDGDVESVQLILDDNPTVEELNERDHTGKSPLSHACVGRILPIVDMLSEVEGVDVNTADKEGNTPLIFSSQAGSKEIVKVLLDDFTNIKVDIRNKMGFTPLMKAAIQGRTCCAKLLLYAGANPKLRDNGRKLCATEWARFTGRTECANEIAKFATSKRFLFGTNSKKGRHERSNSEPDLTKLSKNNKEYVGPQRHKSRSLKYKIKRIIQGHQGHHSTSRHVVDNHLSDHGSNPFAIIARCVSTPILPGGIPAGLVSPSSPKRLLSVENIPRVEVTSPGNANININAK